MPCERQWRTTLLAGGSGVHDVTGHYAWQVDNPRGRQGVRNAIGALGRVPFPNETFSCPSTNPVSCGSVATRRLPGRPPPR